MGETIRPLFVLSPYLINDNYRITKNKGKKRKTRTKEGKKEGIFHDVITYAIDVTRQSPTQTLIWAQWLICIIR